MGQPWIMEATQYKWKDRSMISLNPQVVGEHFALLSSHHNAITPQLILDDGRSKDSPTHTYFVWNDTVAAEKYRLSQAAKLLRSVVYVNVEEPEAEPIRAFVRVEEDDESHFVTTAYAMSHTNLRAQVLHNAMNELKAFRSKYATLKELAKVFKAIDTIPV